MNRLKCSITVDESNFKIHNYATLHPKFSGIIKRRNQTTAREKKENSFYMKIIKEQKRDSKQIII